ncbi:hypothetical protein LF599_06810 [Pseudodesulfovibrio thermohalotolerans]|uniref:hypothetical protein n=1 Tax=Pseudodesulfovibrio thermohalotolerans TaxID=2880651 RepID=UPI0022B9E2C2|nr:hypothetical protein [Pseudodesulfovibrio thermohalotolerans]WFS63866.1 hypothetical protein LF599_06810 [Pseudodesulfovibrio thermohalotolerans]
MEISRKDVLLDEKKFSGLIGSGMNSRHSLAEIFSGICMYLEESGEVVAEFNPTGGTLHYVTFQIGDWTPSDSAPARIVRAYEDAVIKAEKCGVVYDIFTGERLLSGVGRRGKNLGDLLREAVEDL